MLFSDRIVLSYLAEAQGTLPAVTVTIDKIAKDSGVSFPTVQRALKRLEQSNAIQRERLTAFVYTYKVVKHG